eukprot:COSAG06_NODE_2728_length_6381_cov_2.712034_2_plen_45_part_00
MLQQSICVHPTTVNRDFHVYNIYIYIYIYIIYIYTVNAYVRHAL